MVLCEGHIRTMEELVFFKDARRRVQGASHPSRRGLHDPAQSIMANTAQDLAVSERGAFSEACDVIILTWSTDFSKLVKPMSL